MATASRGSTPEQRAAASAAMDAAVAAHDAADAVSTPGAPYAPVGQTLNMTTLKMSMSDYNEWVAVNDLEMTKYDYSEGLTGFRDNYNAIVQNNAAVGPDLDELDLPSGIGLAVILAPAALALSSASLPALAELSGYEGSAGTMFQAAGC